MAKVKVDFRDIKAKVKELKNAILSVSRETLYEAIVEKSILLGVSPVQGTGKFQKYSESYKKSIKDGRYKRFGKTISPVNLKLSGKMLDSFFVKKEGPGLKVGFNHELAEIHTVQGAGKSKVIRKMLPVGQGEEFKRSIQKEILDLVQKGVDRILGK